MKWHLRLSISFAFYACSQFDTGYAKSTWNSNTKPLDARTFFSLSRVGAPSVSPDSTRLVYHQTHYIQDDNKSARFINLMDVASGDIKQLTPNSVGEMYTDPIWLDNDTIAFSYHGAIYSLSLATGVNTTIFAPQVPTSPVVKSSGVVTFVAGVYPGTTLAETAELAEQEAAKPSPVRVFDNIWARHITEWMSPQKGNVFSAPLVKQGDTWAVGNETNLMKSFAPFSDPLLSWDAENYAVDKQGKNVALVVRNPSLAVAYKTDVDIYLLSTDGSTKPKLLTEKFESIASEPAFSDDGRYLAWLQMEVPQYEASIRRIYIYDIKTGNSKSIARDWDSSPSKLLWSTDGKKLFALVEEAGNTIVYSVDVATGKRERLTSSGTVFSMLILDKDHLILMYSEQDKLINHYILDVNTKALRQLTNVNADKLKDVYVGDAEDFWFTGARGDKVHGWMVKPPNFDAKKKYPVALFIHGGPQAASIHAFTYSIDNINLYASAGFICVEINFHGSTGYGQNFTDSVRNQWGNYPYKDLMNGLDYLIDKHSYVDENRMVAVGASYGGYMINWLNGNTKRFKAFVCMAGAFSLPSLYYTTDELWFPEYDFMGVPFTVEGRRNYEKYNPERFADNFSTPTLFVQGGVDFRVPVEQSLAPFTLLRRKNIPAKLMYYAEEGHGFANFGSQIPYLAESLKWVTKFVNITIPYSLE
ncbi:dipeptidylpeptidase [Coemansia sp. Benny D115]|nr:dipeptidylpeptidase [Coemansia sp. Benny D115]